MSWMLFIWLDDHKNDYSYTGHYRKGNKMTNKSGIQSYGELVLLSQSFSFCNKLTLKDRNNMGLR